tara:strand:+ start:1408 stop:3438 length:2031 start_codon:yes stop_codon:yes gene_type:complete
MKLISVIGAVCVIALGGYWFAYESGYRLTDRQASTENSIEFITVQLERKDLINYDELDGILEYGDPFVVTSLTSGVLTDVAAEGSEVKRGALVYRLYRSITDSEWLLAEQQHASASASLSQAELALEKLSVEPTESQIASADAAISQAQANLSKLLDGPTTAEIASADATILQAEATLKKLKTPPAQSEIVAADSTVTKAEGDLSDRSAKAESALYSLRVSRKAYCDTTGRFYPGYPLWPPVCENWDSNTLVAMTESELNSVRENYFAYSWSISISKELLAASDSYLAAAALQNSAQKALDSAKEKRKALDEPTKSYDIDHAEAALTSAKEKRAGLDNPADESQIKQAEDALDSAKKKRADLEIPPTDLELSQARLTIVSAQASLNSADQKLTDLREGPVGAVLMYGALPAWRDFEIGMEPGTDVLQLKENLVALGYGNFKNLRKDNVFDDETSRVISRMQSSLGLTTNGSLSFGEVIFMPGPSVIASNTQFPQTGSMFTDKTTLLTLTPLQSVNTTIMSNGDVIEGATSLQRVSTQIDVADQTLVAVGTNVKIELPNNQLVDGRVASVGDVAIVPSGNQAGNPYLEVTIDIVGTEDLQQWTGASVVVSVTESVASNVLSAPITSLLALLGGGYALEVAENTGTRLVAVELGVYADNWVQISGAGLDENTLVVVPK